MFDFSGKVLFLTGANGGITRAIARTFFELGASCVLTDLDGRGVREFAKNLDALGSRVIGLKQDVTKPEDARQAVAAAGDRFGKIDYLVTGAGIYRDKLIQDMTGEEWHQTISINLHGVFYTCRAAIPLLPEGGAIVNIASVAGHCGSVMHSHYAAAKGAVLTFSRSLALELAPGIRVNAVSPGLIETPLIQPLIEVRGPALIEQTPLKRFGKPEEVARTVAFLCSGWASFITGETLHVNGGLYIAS